MNEYDLKGLVSKVLNDETLDKQDKIELLIDWRDKLENIALNTIQDSQQFLNNSKCVILLKNTLKELKESNE